MPSKSETKLSKKEQEVKDLKLKQKRNKRTKLIIVGCGALFLVLTLLAGGVFLGVYGYPKAISWVNDIGLGKFLGVAPKEDGSGFLQLPDSRRVVVSEESAVIKVVEDATPGVVSIAVNSSVFDPQTGVVDSTDQIGSGFFVDSKGIIATNQHVVSQPDSSYVVVTEDGEKHEVTDIIRDDVNDIALLVIEEGKYPVLTLGDSDELKVGQQVVAIGTPLGEFPGTVSTGVVSGLHREVQTSSGGFFFRGTVRTYEDVIQTDAAVNPGNSGGPLLDLDGNVIGINFAKTSADNISFALPINVLKSRLDEYKKHGRFLKPYIGVTYQIITEGTASRFEDVVAGAFIQSVDPTGPAGKAGIKKGDIVTEIDGEKVEGSFASVIQSKKIGQKVLLKVYRDGQLKEITVTLGERGE